LLQSLLHSSGQNFEDRKDWNEKEEKGWKEIYVERDGTEA